MATIKIEIVAGANTYTSTKTVSAAHLVRLLDAQKSLRDLEDGVTNEQVAEAWFSHVFKTTRGAVADYERRVAREASDDAIADIDLT